MKKINRTVVDLIIGMIICSLCFEIIGIIVVDNKLKYTFGLWLGTFVETLFVVHMYKTLNLAVTMDADNARKYIQKMSLLRALLSLIIVGLSMYFSVVSYISVVIGMLGLKLSSFIQPLVNKYITIKILKEGGEDYGVELDQYRE